MMRVELMDVVIVIYWDDGDSGEAATVHYLLESEKTVLPVVMVMA